MIKAFSLLVLVAAASPLGAQIPNGKMTLITSLSNFSINSSKAETSQNAVPTQTYRVHGINLNPEVMLGRIHNNRLFSYGLSVGFNFSKQNDMGDWRVFSIAPTVGYLKYYPLSEKIALSPFARLSAGYQHSRRDASPGLDQLTEKDFIGSLYLYPFSATVQISPKTSFIFTLSRIALEYDNGVSYFEPRLNNAKTTSRNLLLQANLNTVGFGIQKVFQ